MRYDANASSQQVEEPDEDEINYEIPGMLNGNGLKRSISTPLPTDSYDLFCLSVAQNLRNMPREVALKTQIQIMNIIYENEFPQE